MSSLKFKIFRGGEYLSTEEFDREIIKIGRLSSAHLRLDDEKVSRIHAVVEVSAGGEVNIIDMGSAEGTFVNGDKVNKATLIHGDEIQVGQTRLVFVDPEQGETLAAEESVASAPDLVEAPAAVEAAASEAPTEQGLDPVAGALAEEDFSAPDLGEPEEQGEEREVEAPPVQVQPQEIQADKFAQAAHAAEVDRGAGQSAPDVDLAHEEYGDEGEEVFTYRVALPPPKELGDLDDDERVRPDNWALEVRKLWGNTVLDVKYFKPEDKQVIIGDLDKKVHFYLSSDGLPARAFPVARVVGGEAVLSFNNAVSGNLTTADGTVTALQDLARGSQVGQDPDFGGCRIFTLPQGSVATLMFGNVGLRFRYRSEPAGFLSRLTDRLDYTFLNTLLLMFFVFAAMMATFHLRPKSVETSEEELYKVPDRFVQFILTRPKPEKKDLNFLERLKSDIDGKKSDSAERYKGAEGKMGVRGKPDTGRRSAVRAIKIDDKEVVGNRGLLAVLGSGGPQGLSTVMGGSGLGGELEGAIGNMFGAQVGESGGFGGLGLKGTGTGGGGVGNTIGVGRLGTRGRGGGRFGYGTGVSRIKRRGERNINISVGRPIIMGSLSMEIIRRVIHSHRDQIKYCYSKELTRNPNLSGKVTIKFTISPKGFVQTASVSGTTLNNATVEHCITGKVRTWKFPEPKGGGIVIVNYPFILKSQ